MNKSFIEEFEVKEEIGILNDVSDYEAFSNKELLDELRNKIIQNIEEDFRFKNAIISKEEKDLTKEMSAGFNSKIYFQIL